MSKIYDLNQEQLDLLDALSWKDAEEDAEEIAEIEKRLMQIRGSAENTLKFLSNIYLQLGYDLSVKKDEETRLKALVAEAAKRAKMAARERDRVSSIMVRIMKEFNIDKFSTGYSDFKRTIAPGEVIYRPDFDVRKLSEFYVRTIPERQEPNGKEICAALRARIKDSKGRLDKTTTEVACEELPRVVLVRKEGISG